MSTVESPLRDGQGGQPPAQQRGLTGLLTAPGQRLGRLGTDQLVWGSAIAAILLLAFGLRIWGVGHGLPYAYNSDENAHFVTRAIGMFGHGWDPNYYVNPPAYTYLVHIALAVRYGGRAGVADAFAAHPTQIWLIARTLSALCGTFAVWLLYLGGARLVDRRVGLLAAGIFAVAFLPVFYAKLALNDVPTLVGVCLGLWGAAGILRDGRLRHYAWAALGLGLACATKYTGGIVLLPIIAAAGAQFLAPGGRGLALRGIGIVAGLSLLAFIVANPYAVLDFPAFWDGLTHQSTASGDAAGKLGLTQDSGYAYYVWSFGWGLGWLPLIFAIGGAVRLFFDERRLLWMLAPAVLLFVLFMGSQERYFGRWLMPIFPLVCVLAAYAAIELADWLGRFSATLRPTFVTGAVVLLCGQGFVYSLHSGLVMSREDTRNIARHWMAAHVPTGTKVVIEPVVPDQWAQDIGHPSPVTKNGNRWNKYPLSRSNIDPKTGARLPGAGVVVNIEDFEKVLRPQLVDTFEQQGYCWVLVGSTQRGRAEAAPDQVPKALEYYKTLERHADVAYEVSPYSRGKGPVPFNFDWTFNYYPLAYNRPGPTLTIYRLRGGVCAAGQAANR
jgi:dolichyl-phosphate-mannose-protein mannosyltransferase